MSKTAATKIESAWAGFDKEVRQALARARKLRISDSMTISVQLVTPELALEWLANNSKNRDLSQSYIDKLARDIESGAHKFTHQGVAFDEDGNILDGQHRLWAIVISKIAVPLLVFRGFSRSTATVIDTHRNRSAGDALFFETGERVQPVKVATLRQMLRGIDPASRNDTHTETMELWKTHGPACEFAVQCFPKRQPRISAAPVLGVVARAWYTQDRDELRRFCEVLVTGMAKIRREQTIIALRDTLVRGQGSRGDSWPRQSVWGKTQQALKYYLDGKPPLKKLAGVLHTDLFKVPGIKEYKKTKDAGKDGPSAQAAVYRYVRNKGTAVTVQDISNAMKISYGIARSRLEMCYRKGWLVRETSKKIGNPYLYRASSGEEKK